MATAALTTAQQNLLNSDTHIVTGVKLFNTPRQVVATGEVTALDDINICTELTVNWSFLSEATLADSIYQGYLIEVTDANNRITSAVVRKVITGDNKLYISTTANGAPGYPLQKEKQIEVGHTVNVYNHIPMWSIYSRVDVDNKVIYKLWDVPYTDENSQPPPVANINEWLHGVATDTFSLSADESFAHGSATITAYEWKLPGSLTLATGALTSNNITVTGTPGAHRVILTVTDSNSNTHTAQTWIFIEGTGYTLLNDSVAWNITADLSDRIGRELELSATLPGKEMVDLHPGDGIMLTYDILFDGVLPDDGVLSNKFIGYITSLETSHSGDTVRVSIVVSSPLRVADKLPLPSQSIEEINTPTRWVESTQVITTLRGSLFYMMRWHVPGLLSAHTLKSNVNNTLRRQFIEVSANSALTSLQQIVNIFYPKGNIGCLSNGNIIVKRHPNLSDVTYRNSLATIWTFEDKHVSPNVLILHRLVSSIKEVEGGAFSWDGSNIVAVTAEKKWGNGLTSEQLETFTVAPGNEVQQVIETLGHFYAMQNAQIVEVDFNINGIYDIIEPAAMQWVAFNLSADYIGYKNAGVAGNWQAIPNVVERTWNIENNVTTLSISISVQPETFGQSAKEVVYPNVVNDNLTGFDGEPFVPYYNQDYELIGGVGSVATDGLTQVQLEESLLKYALSVVLKTELDNTGTTGSEVAGEFIDEDGDGFDDETGEAIPSNTERTDGRYFGASSNFVSSIKDINSQYDAFVTTDATTAAAELAAYAEALYDLSGSASAFSGNVDSNSGFLSLNASAQIQLSEDIFYRLKCNGGQYVNAISDQAYKGGYTVDERNLIVEWATLLTTAQFDAWSELGQPYTGGNLAPCYIWPPQSFTITPTGGNSFSHYISGEPTLWEARVDPTLVRVTQKGGMTHPDGHIMTATHTYNANNDSWSWNPLLIGKRDNNASGNSFDGFSVDYLEFDEFSSNGNGLAPFSGIFDYKYSSAPSPKNFPYAIKDVRAPYGTTRSDWSGSVTVIIADQGEI